MAAEGCYNLQGEEEVLFMNELVQLLSWHFLRQCFTTGATSRINWIRTLQYVCSDLPPSALADKSRKLLKFVSLMMKLKACEREDGVSLPDSETLSHLLQMLDCVQNFQELQDNQDELTDIITEMKCQEETTADTSDSMFLQNNSFTTFHTKLSTFLKHSVKKLGEPTVYKAYRQNRKRARQMSNDMEGGTSEMEVGGRKVMEDGGGGESIERGTPELDGGGGEGMENDISELNIGGGEGVENGTSELDDGGGEGVEMGTSELDVVGEWESVEEDGGEDKDVEENGGRREAVKEGVQVEHPDSLSTDDSEVVVRCSKRFRRRRPSCGEGGVTIAWSDESSEVQTPPSRLPTLRSTITVRSRDSLLTIPHPKQTVKSFRAKRVPFSEEEVRYLEKGVEKFGVGQWKKIRQLYKFNPKRNNTDLKDKWRNLLKKKNE